MAISSQGRVQKARPYEGAIMEMPKPPETFREFTREFPALAEAWAKTQDAAAIGPLDERLQRLVKLAIAIGSGRDGAVSSAVRKALAHGVTSEEMDQVLMLAAGTIGFPATVAAYSTIRREQAKA
jgi:4-carboxymuconolactone decarboxylase